MTPENGGPFAVDEERALDAMRWLWGDCYTVDVRSGTWTAKRLDGLGGEIEAAYPDDLNREIRNDYATKPVRLP